MKMPRMGASQGPDALPKPSALKRRAIDLLREARRLHKKKQKKVDAAGVQLVAERIADVDRLLPSRKNAIELDGPALNRATLALDQSLSSHFGQWRKSSFRELIEALSMAVLLAIVIRFFIVEAFSIPSSSMYPTLEIGDHLFISKIRYGLYAPFSTSRLIAWDQPNYGDVIVFEHHNPGHQHDGDDYIKRVVALPGDRIRLENDVIVLNGKPIQTEVVATTTCALFASAEYDDTVINRCPCVIQRETIGSNSWESQHITEVGCSPGTVEPSDRWPLEQRPMVSQFFGTPDTNPNFPDVLVPEGHVFVMGDNRDNSQDSRFWGFVSNDRIKGKAFIIFWARDKSRLLSGMY